MTKNIKVAVIGAGMMGKNHLKTYANMPGVKLVGIYDVFPDAAKAAAKTYGIKAFSSMEEVAKKTEGVKDCVVNFMTLKMEVEFEDGADEKSVMKMVEKNCKKVEDDCEIFYD